MDKHTLLNLLLYQALLDIRSAAYEGKGTGGIFKLADLFHNVPLKLNKERRGEGDYEKLFLELKQMATMKGCDSWLNNAIIQLTST